MLDEASVQELIAKTRDFTAGTIKPQDFYAYLKIIASSRFNLEDSYPSLSSYISYLTMSKSIKAEALLREISLLENKIKQGLCANEGERQLSDIDAKMRMAVKFLKLELTPEEYAVFDLAKDQYMSVAWIPYLVEACVKNGIPETPRSSEALDDNFDTLENFYKLGVARENAFLKNLTQKIASSGETAAVVITGGFHTEGLNRMLREAGYSYAVITPAITQKSDPELYFSVLRSEQGRVNGDDSGLTDDNN